MEIYCTGAGAYKDGPEIFFPQKFLARFAPKHFSLYRQKMFAKNACLSSFIVLYA